MEAGCDYFLRISHKSIFYLETLKCHVNDSVADTADGKASVDQVKNIGRIKLEVNRIYRVKLASPRYVSKTLGKQITEVSEKMLKGKAIVNTIG